MSPAYVESIGLFAPGLPGWRASLPILSGESPYTSEPLPRYKPQLLSGNERRRATNSVRIAFGAAEDAIGQRLQDARQLASVFVSSGGDYGVHDQICRSLMREEVMLSPTQFHNSVHNAPAGYWSIATGCRAPSVSLSAYDYSIAAGLLEALPFVDSEQQPTLLVYSDGDTCEPMRQKRHVQYGFAAALWLTPQRTANSCASLAIALDDLAAEEVAAAGALESLRRDNPAARILPLLEHIAVGESTTLFFPTAAGQRVTATLQVL